MCVPFFLPLSSPAIAPKDILHPIFLSKITYITDLCHPHFFWSFFADGPPLRSPITTHVLDTSIGKPAPQVNVRLERLAPGSINAWETVALGQTNNDGRVPDLLPPSDEVSAGVYRISFDTLEYMSRCKAQHPTFFPDRPFYPAASVQFQITQEQVSFPRAIISGI